MKLALVFLLCAQSALGITLVCLGDSNTDPYLSSIAPTWCEDVATEHPTWDVINGARSGGTIVSPSDWPSKPSMVENQWLDVQPRLVESPTLIVLAFGTNDLYWTPDAQIVADGMETYRAALEARTGALVLLATIPPRFDVFRWPASLGREANRLLRRQVPHDRLIAWQHMPLREVVDGGIHWGPDGQLRRAGRVEHVLRRLGYAP